jgi:hypothetical protein
VPRSLCQRASASCGSRSMAGLRRSLANNEACRTKFGFVEPTLGCRPRGIWCSQVREQYLKSRPRRWTSPLCCRRWRRVSECAAFYNRICRILQRCK